MTTIKPQKIKCQWQGTAARRGQNRINQPTAVERRETRQPTAAECGHQGDADLPLQPSRNATLWRSNEGGVASLGPSLAHAASALGRGCEHCLFHPRGRSYSHFLGSFKGSKFEISQQRHCVSKSSHCVRAQREANKRDHFQCLCSSSNNAFVVVVVFLS